MGLPASSQEAPLRSEQMEKVPPPEEAPEKPEEPQPEIILPEGPRFPATTLEVGPLRGIMATFTAPLEVSPPGWRLHRLGPVRFSPFLEYNTFYRTNINQTYSHKMADLVHLFNPGIRVELPLTGRHAFSFSYLGNGFIYSRHGQKDHFDHNLSLDAALRFPAGLEVLAGVAYRNAVEEVTSTTLRQRPYQRLSPTLQISRRLADKWRLQGNYQYDLYEFADASEARNNRRDHNAGLTLFYKFWPKTALLVQYLLQRRDYPDYSPGNNLSHTPFLGLTWDPTAKLSGTAKMGYTWKSYDHAVPTRDSSTSSWAMSFQLLYRYSRYSQFTLDAQRSMQNDLDYGNRGYENTAFYLTWHKNWHYFKVDSYVTAAYALNDYTDAQLDESGSWKKRRDHLVNFAVGLSRPLGRFLKLRLDYRYINRASNFSRTSYNDQWVGIGVQGSF
jgi:hypothetical protein